MKKFFNWLRKLFFRPPQQPNLNTLWEMLQQNSEDLYNLAFYMSQIPEFKTDKALKVHSRHPVLEKITDNLKLTDAEKLYLTRYEFNLSSFRDEIKIRLMKQKKEKEFEQLRRKN